ncbi:MAG: glycosyltransferase family A protein [Oryzomonas sp.]|uniref:glycosyltransferase family 2 protein n=1 Tax=Oryzomonas sp. TaxID=2855186 RepID=UPI00284826E1|nr:glycosyltransferase family A protein [Oryzomonas sp.]MDR3580283.1 glycosyltransferase family A protein [Oryzomonas sp.]
MTESKIKLSVCVTAYNRKSGLSRTLQSLTKQTRQPDEVIVSDDFSPDDPKDVVDRWAGYFSHFQYNRNPQNLNMPGNLNLAISLARGSYIANLHDADEFDSTLLEKWERALDSYPTAGFAFSGVRSIPQTSGVNRFDLHPVPPFMKGVDFFEKHMVHRYSSYVWGTVMARRAAYQELLPFDAKYGPYSDVDMWMRMCRSYDVAYVREPLILLDDSPSTWRKFDWKRVEIVRQMQFDNIKRFYMSTPERLPIEINRHRKAFIKMCLRRILGRIWHRDLNGVLKGLSLLFGMKNFVKE